MANILKELVQSIQVLEVKGPLDIWVEGLYYDSRKVGPGGLFVAIKGYQTDGHRFIDDAVGRGAVAIVTQQEVEVPTGVSALRVADTRIALGQLAAAFYGYPARRLSVIGVTGTNGKTTTTHLIEEILSQSGRRVGLIGTVGNKIGGRMLPAERTTPESLDLQALLAQMLEEGAGYVVMEASSHALELHRVEGCEYDVGVFTNLTQDHLDFHGTMESYLMAKAKLFTGLSKGQKSRRKYAVINTDDPYGERIKGFTSVPAITYGVKHPADVKARDVTISSSGASFTVVHRNGTFPLRLRMTGMFSVYNVLAACAVGLEEGIAPETIRRVLEPITGVAGRFELVDCGQEFSVVVDYAHTPDGLENVLKTAREVTRQRVITVFGCGGDRDRTKRPVMGEIAARYSEVSIVTSDNPRSEDPLAIISEILPGVQRYKPEAYRVIPDRRRAIETAIDMAKPGDMVVIAGKGHETYQIIGAQVLHFDDREVAREALREKGGACHDAG